MLTCIVEALLFSNCLCSIATSRSLRAKARLREFMESEGRDLSVVEIGEAERIMY